MTRIAWIAACAWITLAWAGPVCAQITVTATPSAPALGAVISAPGATVFTTSPTGDVTRSGPAMRVRDDPVTAPRITIACRSLVPDLCAARRIRVTVQAVAGSPAAITRFRASNFSTPLSLFVTQPPPGGAASVSFTIYPLNLLTMSFDLGMEVSLIGGAPSGPTQFAYTVSAEMLPLL